MPDNVTFQPIVDWQGRPRRLEALARNPGALKSLTAAQLLEWDLAVLGHGASQVAQWQGLHTSLSLAVNILPSHLEQAGFANRVAQQIHASGLPPRLVTLEIVEGQPLRTGRSTVRQNLAALWELGVKLVLDDLGTGYVSTRQQVHDLLLPKRTRNYYFAGLKLAREVTAQLATVTGDRLVQQFMRLARRYGLSVVAEGIETKAQFQRARDLGCHLFQGWHYAPKLPYRQIHAWLEQHPAAA